MNPAQQRSRRLSRRSLLAAALGVAAGAVPVLAQRPIHYPQDARLPLGAVAEGQLARFNHMRGYVQPVELLAPRGVMISVADGGQFGPPEPAPLKVGLQLGHVYRFKVVGIPLREGEEVFPSVELINRLHPPEGQRVRFPVPIELTREELELALDGNYVTRVVYLENPATAFPMVDPPGIQRFVDIGSRQDPLLAADKLGRPMAIVRIGSRVPLLRSDDPNFRFASPPVERYPAEAETPAPAAQPQPANQQPANQQPADQAQHRRGLEPSAGQHYRRTPVGAPYPAPPQRMIARPPAPRTTR